MELIQLNCLDLDFRTLRKSLKKILCVFAEQKKSKIYQIFCCWIYKVKKIIKAKILKNLILERDVAFIKSQESHSFT